MNFEIFKEKISQSHKNIILYIIAFGLIGMAITTYLLNESVIDLIATAEKITQAIETPESIRRRYNSQEDYIIALEEQVEVALKRDQEKWVEEIEFLDILFKVLFIIGISQLVILSVPIKLRNSNK